MHTHILTKYQDEAVNWGGKFTSQIEQERWVFTAAFLSLFLGEKDCTETDLLSLPYSKRNATATEYFLTYAC